eukprot:m.172780 g.172780  ORF g.172780 m.172780 type:complete len:496 (+) comp15376_c0_seq11:1035-2522(+)
MNIVFVCRFSGYTTSDTDAVADAYDPHKYFPSREAACCGSITKGRCDINSGLTYVHNLLQGVAEKLCTMNDVDAAVARTMKVRMEMGLFDPTDDQPLTKIGLESVASKETQALNLETAEQSLVLLRNSDNVLPLTAGKKLAIIGPLASDPTPMMGTHYKGYACPNNDLKCVPSILDSIGIINNATSRGSIVYEEGCDVDKGNDRKIKDAVEAAQDADAVVLVLGITGEQEHEGMDRTSIDLPAVQHNLSAAILALKKPTVIVLINGGMVALDSEASFQGSLAIVEALLPGAVGGTAIANGLFGKHSFGGRLPYTIYRSTFVDETPMSEMELTAKPGRTYRFYNGVVSYPFAHGLSLVPCKLSLSSGTSPQGSLDTAGSKTIDVSIDVSAPSSAEINASQVITAFWKPSASLMNEIPLKSQLFDFQRVSVAPGNTLKVVFSLSASDFEVSEVGTGNIVVLPGFYNISFTDGDSTDISYGLTLTGDKQVIENFPNKN